MPDLAGAILALSEREMAAFVGGMSFALGHDSDIVVRLLPVPGDPVEEDDHRQDLEP